MKIIAVMNQKGGVGKTMTSAAIAYILGEEMKNRVLIADADQQGNVSMLYGVYDPEGLGMPELLEAHQAAGGAYSTKELIQQTTYSNIQIIPANGYLMRTNAELLLVEREAARAASLCLCALFAASFLRCSALISAMDFACLNLT